MRDGRISHLGQEVLGAGIGSARATSHLSLRAASGGVLPANRVATLAVSWTMPHVSSLAQAEIFWTIIRWMDMLPRRIASNLVQAVAF